MSPPAVNAPPAPVTTTNATASSRSSSAKTRRELVARGHRHAVELARDVERDRRDARRRAHPEAVVVRHPVAPVSSRSILRRIFPEAALRERVDGAVLARPLEARERRGEAVRVELLARCAAPTTTRRRAGPSARRARRRRPPRDARMARRARPRPRADGCSRRPSMIMSSTRPTTQRSPSSSRRPGVAGGVPAVADRLRVGVGPVPVARRTPRRSDDAATSDLAVAGGSEAGAAR